MSSQKFIHDLTASSVSTSDLNVSGNFVLKGVAVVSPKSGNRIKIGAIAPGIIVAPMGPLEEVTVIFPQKVTDGQVMFISFTQNVKKVSFSNGKFAANSTIGPAVKGGDSITLFYHGASDKWYKLAGGTSSGGTAKADAGDVENSA